MAGVGSKYRNLMTPACGSRLRVTAVICQPFSDGVEIRDIQVNPGIVVNPHGHTGDN